MHHRRNAFTLIELLVVIAIIAALLAILMPAMGRAVEQGNRVVCGTHIRGMIQYGLTYASENYGTLPDIVDSRGVYGSPSAFPWHLRAKNRDALVSKYGMPRDFFYCPSNTVWNNDAFWSDGAADGAMLVWGYAWYGNNTYTNDATPAVTWVPAPVRYPVCSNRLSDQPDRDVLMTDLTRSGNEQFNYPNPGGANHVLNDRETSPGVMPNGSGGTNNGYRDGSVQWRSQNSMKRQWYYQSGGTMYRVYF